MKRDKISIFVHFVWATWDRLPLITPEIEERLYRNLAASAVSLRCKVLAIGGDRDHVHVLLAMPSTMSVAQVVKKMKGTSSRFVNEHFETPVPFKWQGFYGAFSVSRWDVDKIIGYINRQKEHHAKEELWAELEEMLWEKPRSSE